MEEWKQVAGHEDRYEVSSMGNVRRSSASRGTTAGRLLKPFPNGHGYRQVRLCNNLAYENRQVHRMVATAFLDAPSPDHNEVNHRNGVKDDNRAENLEWCTRQQNCIHSVSVLRRGTSPLSAEQVRSMRAEHAADKLWGRVGRLAAKYGLSSGGASAIISGRSWAWLDRSEAGQDLEKIGQNP